MLRSTGFFRGIECPFDAENSEGNGVRNGCNRPHCLFRHSRGSRSNGAQAHQGTRDLHSTRTEQGYDPFHPEVRSEHGHQNGEPPGHLSGELDMVNKAIEEVRFEMERDKRKLSRIGDEPYDPSQSALASLVGSAESRAAGSHLAYDPGSYKITTAGYNPTPSCSKYTMDSNTQGYDSMEYDPMSNYSTRVLGKNKRDMRSHHVKSKNQKTLNSPQTDPFDDCVVAAKSSLPQYTALLIPVSSDESSDTAYQPSSLNNCQLRKSSGSVAEICKMERKELTESPSNALMQRNNGDLDTQDNLKQVASVEKKKMENQLTYKTSGKHEKLHHSKKRVQKLSDSKVSSSSSSEDSKTKWTSNKDSMKKENKSHVKGEDQKNTVKVGTYDVKREGRDTKGTEDKVQKPKKVKTNGKRDRDTENDVIKSKKIKEHHKDKDKNGKLESGKRRKVEKKFSKGSLSSGTLATSKDIQKQSSSSAVRRLNKKSLSLSHADLFGDESPDESDPIMDVDNAKEVLEGQSPRATKRLNKSTAAKRTQSSSEDKGHIGSDFDNSVFDTGFLMEDLDFTSDPIEECLRIFNESNDVKREDKGRQAKQASSNEDVKSTESTLTTLFPGQKRRVSHCVSKGNTETPSQPVVQPTKRPSAQEVCYQRIQKAQQQAAKLMASGNAPSEGLKYDSPGRKKRVALIPSSQMTSPQTSSARPAASPQSGNSDSGTTLKSQTTAGILSKTSSTVKPKRVAHTPTMKSTSLRRPVIPSEFGAKVPTNIRQRYLNEFIDECVKFCSSEDAAHSMALDEEKLVYDRSNSKKIYLNLAVNTLKKLRNQSSSTSPPATNSPGYYSKKKPQSHQDVLGGRLAATTSFTLNRRGKQQEERLEGAALYRKLKAYLMTKEQLQEHGYPRQNPEAPGRAIINVTAKKVALDPFTKICCRCGAEYKITSTGSYARKEECSYHWGRLQPRKVAGGWERIYSCCSAGVGDPGCQIARQHVQDGRKESLDGYVSTFSKPLPADGNGGVFALDCEMCYTMQGLELTRVTVINSELKVIYDTFVKPENKVLDYNTRFSGITKEDLKNTTINLRDVQAVLLSMFSAESILMGHSLESDLLALKLIHSTIVDTAIVFPHRLGLPYKRALKNLMADYLKRIIQDDVGGHDSSEDASACMELMIWKIKEDAKVKI
ncbi:RNA exonuclease 1 homolog [Salarias fasciatus]|uniref:Exonuclease domain-containing protein n=1 Tax=Salarias fasciatus TaxID=181472 RepID=A0A672JNI1_SALFA|nr:RNA exonuclease 1 homolog [Salarias fasciatus]